MGRVGDRIGVREDAVRELADACGDVRRVVGVVGDRERLVGTLEQALGLDVEDRSDGDVARLDRGVLGVPVQAQLLRRVGAVLALLAVPEGDREVVLGQRAERADELDDEKYLQVALGVNIVDALAGATTSSTPRFRLMTAATSGALAGLAAAALSGD